MDWMSIGTFILSLALSAYVLRAQRRMIAPENDYPTQIRAQALEIVELRKALEDANELIRQLTQQLEEAKKLVAALERQNTAMRDDMMEMRKEMIALEQGGTKPDEVLVNTVRRLEDEAAELRNQITILQLKKAPRKGGAS